MALSIQEEGAHMDLTVAHWVYLASVVAIIAFMVARKDVVLPAIAATALTALAYTGDLVVAFSSLFNASLVAAGELFSIFLIIAVMASLLGSLRAIGADKRMVRPFRKIMINGHISFFVIAFVTYVISLFFYPTPAVPLVGLILLPVAIRAGLPAMGAALAIAIAGQGMALSSDYVIQVAPSLSAAAADIEVGDVADKALVLSLITGGVALVLAYSKTALAMKRPSPALLEAWERGTEPGAEAEVSDSGQQSKSGGPESDVLDGQHDGKGATILAVLTPLIFGALVLYLVLGRFTGLVRGVEGDQAAALVGGIGTVLLLVTSLVCDGRLVLGTVAKHVVDGFVFAFRIMGVVLPIAGFFFIGNADFAASIMSLEEDATSPAFLFDLVEQSQALIPNNELVMAFSILVIGMISGLDGSGFSGLPLTGSLSAALAPQAGMDVSTLAALGQLGGIWAGGGVLVAWSSLLAVAGFARVSAVDIARSAFLPVISGLLIATVAAVLLW